jgi:hypothetical protein
MKVGDNTEELDYSPLKKDTIDSNRRAIKSSSSYKNKKLKMY